MKETYTEVLCGASEDLLHALNEQPQRYIPAIVQLHMLGLRKKLGNTHSDTIEDEAEVLVDELDRLSGSMPASILNYVRNLRAVLNNGNLAS